MQVSCKGPPDLRIFIVPVVSALCLGRPYHNEYPISWLSIAVLAQMLKERVTLQCARCLTSHACSNQSQQDRLCDAEVLHLLLIMQHQYLRRS